MHPLSLTTLVYEQLAAARAVGSRRNARTVYGGHEHALRQTLIALTAGSELADHSTPGEATPQVLHGHVRITTDSREAAVAGPVWRRVGRAGRRSFRVGGGVAGVEVDRGGHLHIRHGNRCVAAMVTAPTAALPTPHRAQDTTPSWLARSEDRRSVDTHRDTHQVEIALPNGAPIAVTTISNDTTGYAELLAWIVDHAPGPRLALSIEGTRSYGVGLARAANAAGLLVVECEQPNRKARRGRGKSDPIDAHLAVLAALRLDADRLPTPRADGDREALRILLGARQELTTASTAQTNRLRALLLGGDDTDRTLARGPLTDTRLAGLARRRPPRDASREQAVRHAEIRRLALALRAATRELKTNRSQLQTIVNDIVPGLIERRGIGPVSAAQAIVSFSHPGRCRNDAAFAALAGASPLPASSGRTVRHRLNRGGDRALNRALHTIATTRMRSCPTTQAYVARRTAQGKTPKEIRRCLKRYIARQLYRTLTTAMTPATEVS